MVLMKLSDLHNTKSGRAFVMGNGPSLNLLDLEKLKGEAVFCSNRIYLGYDIWNLDFEFPYWGIEDKRVCEDTQSEWNTLEAEIKFIPEDCLHWVTNQDNVCVVNLVRSGYKVIGNKIVYWPDFCIDGNMVYHGMTVTYYLIQIALSMGYNPIYLIGVDHYYQRTDDIREGTGKLISSGPDPDHFTPDYFAKGRKYHIPRTDLSTNSYRVAELSSLENGFKIYNASAQTTLDIFERVNYDDLF